MTTVSAKRTQNVYTDEQIARLEQVVSKHNEGKSLNETYFIVDLTGDKQVFFTLYKYRKPISGYVNPYQYVKNLSIDLEQAVEEVLHRAKGVPVLICYEDNNNPLLSGFRKRTKEGIPNIPFGQYKGKTIAEVWDIDRKYVMWFNKEYKTKPYEFRGRFYEPKLTAEDVLLKENAKTLVDFFWEEWRKTETEKNLAECTSDFVGKLKNRITIEVTVTKVDKKSDYTKVYLEDFFGNIIYIYGNEDAEVGAKYNLVGTPTQHIEKLGKKMTYFNRVKLSKA